MNPTRRKSAAGMLSTGDAARIMGSSRQHVVDMCTRGELPFIWIGRHRRVQRSDLDSLLDVQHRQLTRDQERSLWLHRALVGRLMEQPDQVMNLARKNAIHLLRQQQRTGMTTHWLTEWLRVLDRGVDEVAEVLTSRNPLSLELRQNSPFAGALPQETRSRVLAAFVQHWRDDHHTPPKRTGHDLVEA
ncbi:MAG: helix-turn-helix domain-containing protein [Actinomycetota bacterium]|nr:helix-turn-helix domain-containing protein [Actinomycetota bacterium]